MRQPHFRHAAIFLWIATAGVASGQQFSFHTSLIPITIKSSENNTAGLAVADFNQDGIPDLLVHHDASLDVFLGKGDGTFRPMVSTPVDPYSFEFAVGDFNNDGKPDVATEWPTNILGLLQDIPVDIYFGNGDGTFTKKGSVTTRSDFAAALVATDVNGDGKLDLVGDVFVALGNGDGSFQPLLPTPLDKLQAIGDFNGDGKPDLLGIAGNMLQFAFGGATGPSQLRLW